MALVYKWDLSATIIEADRPFSCKHSSWVCTIDSVSGLVATPGVDLKSRNSAQFWILSSFSFTQENVWLLVHFKQRPNVQERLACVASRLCHSHLHVVVYGTSIKSIEVAQPYVYCTLISWSWSWGTISKDSNDRHSWTRTDLSEGSWWHIHIFWVQCTQDKVYITVVKEKITYIWQRGFSSVVCSWL
jgi:hypothetical protein